MVVWHRQASPHDPLASGPHRPDRHRAAVRFPERPARRCELDRDGRLDARVETPICRALGGVLQLHRLCRLRPPRRADRRHRHRPCAGDRRAGDLRRADRRDRVERHHLGARHPLEQQPRADRRAARRGRRQDRLRRDRLERRDQDRQRDLRLARGRAAARAAARPAGRLDQPQAHPARRRQALPQAPADLRRALFARPRRQRRAEDDGDHRGAALFAGAARRRVPCALLGRAVLPGGYGARHAVGRLADRPYHGVEDHPADARTGFCAETGGAITLFAATFWGVPVSSTHTITGAIVGVGAARRLSAVRWNVASNIIIAWTVTLPAAAAIGAATYWLTGLFI
ncbi:hypothetical protein SPHINGOT1_250021 [Sphingomonas sp. T1]|nr:hypothetical protein SPHINGOT1_250021 [Sphingomonas sp. T1]